MTSNFATPDDVATALLRPLTDLELTYIDGLLNQAAALLRLAAPSIDDRINRWNVNSADLSAVSPTAVKAVVAGIIKKYLINPSGIATETDTVGPYSHSTSYALRSEKEARGVLQVTPADLATLFPNRKRLRAGTIRTRAALAPRPVGRYGPWSTPGRAVEAVITFGGNGVVEIGEPVFIGWEVGPGVIL